MPKDLPKRIFRQPIFSYSHQQTRMATNLSHYSVHIHLLCHKEECEHSVYIDLPFQV